MLQVRVSTGPLCGCWMPSGSPDMPSVRMASPTLQRAMAGFDLVLAPTLVSHRKVHAMGRCYSTGRLLQMCSKASTMDDAAGGSLLTSPDLNARNKSIAKETTTSCKNVVRAVKHDNSIHAQCRINGSRPKRWGSQHPAGYPCNKGVCVSVCV